MSTQNQDWQSLVCVFSFKVPGNVDAQIVQTG